MPAPKGHLPYPGCEKGGRPRRYSEEDIEKLADELIDWMKDESHFWFKDFCLERGINPNLMTKLARENEKFSEAYELVKDMQESRVFKGALMKNFNPTMAKFVLMNCHGWSEKNETRISANSENPITALFESITNTSRDLVQDNEKRNGFDH